MAIRGVDRFATFCRYMVKLPPVHDLPYTEGADGSKQSNLGDLTAAELPSRLLLYVYACLIVIVPWPALHTGPIGNINTLGMKYWAPNSKSGDLRGFHEQIIILLPKHPKQYILVDTIFNYRCNFGLPGTCL